MWLVRLIRILFIRLPYVIHLDFQSILKKKDSCQNNQISYTMEVNKQSACGFSFGCDELKKNHFFIEAQIV